MRRVGIPELGRMEAHLKELQAENDKLQARLERLTEAYEQKFLHKRSDLRDARYRNNKLEAGNEKLQAELAESARIRFELRTDNAKLRAVVDMTREILVEAEDYEKRTGKTISWLNKLRDAIKEVGDE